MRLSWFVVIVRSIVTRDLLDGLGFDFDLRLLLPGAVDSGRIFCLTVSSVYQGWGSATGLTADQKRTEQLEAAKKAPPPCLHLPYCLPIDMPRPPGGVQRDPLRE